MIEHLRRKNVSEAAEATVEVGKLLYLLGRRGEALQRFDDAIEADDDRDQSYIDIVAFLVQAGETDAALSVYHRGLARPGRAVSEYVKIYTSLWVLDLTRRTNKTPDPKAEAYLRSLDERHGELRPHRGAAWSRLLGRYAVGKISYDQALAAADTTGKRAEIYFYEAMHRLEDGKSDDAHQLWQKVLDTQMLSFFEFEMASRYLRTGAPTSPVLGTSSGARPAEAI
jgi:tetratricopeptide (TPR) repeat protein